LFNYCAFKLYISHSDQKSSNPLPFSLSPSPFRCIAFFGFDYRVDK
jgi:hypothetical protein